MTTTPRRYGLTPGQPSLLSAGLDLCWAEKCETDDALADYNEAVRIDPKSAKAYDYRGIACFAKKDYDMAIADYSEAIRLDPKIVRLSGLSGHVLGSDQDAGLAPKHTPRLTQRTGPGTIAAWLTDGFPRADRVDKLIMGIASMNKGVMVAGKGRSIWVIGDSYTIKCNGNDTSEAYALIEAFVPPGGGPPPHLHRREHEAFYVLDGELQFHVEGRSFMATSGLV